MNLYSCYKFYQLIDRLPEVVRRNLNCIDDGWLWGDQEIYPQFNPEEYYSIIQSLLQQAIVGRYWSFGIVSPLPYSSKNYFVVVYKHEDTVRIDLGVGMASSLCTALLVAYVAALEKSKIIKGSGA